MPYSSPTIARREPTIRLNSVDLPTFGRPTMARRGRETVMDEQYPRRDSHPRLSAVMQAVRATGQPRVAVPTRAVEYYRDSVASTSQPSASAQKKDVSLYQFFSPGGVLSRTHPAYEFRRGQLQMAQAVEQVLGEKRHLIVEAGSGTSSTLAPTPVSARNAARGIDVLSPKCTAGRWRATSSSSIIIYFLRTWRSSSKPKTRMMQASCPTRAR